MPWPWKRGTSSSGRGVGTTKYAGNLEERDVIGFSAGVNSLNMKAQRQWTQEVKQSVMTWTIFPFFFFLNKFIYLFIYFWLCWVSIAARGPSPVVVSRGYSSLRCAGLSLRLLPSLQSTGSRHAGFSSCGTQAQQLWLTGCRAQAQLLWRTGPVAPRHVGSFRTRAQTHVPCIGRRTPSHCATREAPYFPLKKNQCRWTVSVKINQESEFKS